MHVLVDGSRSMDWGRQNKFTYAKSLAGSLGYIALNRDDVLSAAVFSETVEQYFAPAQGRAFILRYFDFLEQVEPVGGATSLVSALRNYVARNAQRGLVILISDMMTEDAYRGITAIQEAGNELVLLHVLEWAEFDPELSGELSLVDRETGRTINVAADAETLNQYREHVLDWADQLEAFCGRRNARYVRLETSWPLEEVVFQRLLRRVVLLSLLVPLALAWGALAGLVLLFYILRPRSLRVEVPSIFLLARPRATGAGAHPVATAEA